jgi:hypothetical protein
MLTIQKTEPGKAQATETPGRTSGTSILASAENGPISDTEDLVLRLQLQAEWMQPTTCNPFGLVHGKELTQGYQGKDKPWTADLL